MSKVGNDKNEGENEGQGDDESQGEDNGQGQVCNKDQDRKKMRALFHERQWMSDKIRRILQEHLAQYLGTRVSISAWRHIAITISRRYLQGKFGEEGDKSDNSEENNVCDLQAGHSTHVAGMIYGRILEQGAAGMAN